MWPKEFNQQLYNHAAIKKDAFVNLFMKEKYRIM